MRIVVSEIPEEGLTVRITGDSLDREALRGIAFEAPPVGDAFVERVGLHVLIRGHLKAVLEIECSRCVDRVSFPLDIDFRHTLRPYDKKLSNFKEVELHTEDLEFGHYEDDFVELGPIIEEHIVLSLPMKPLCRDDCKGLCPRCGSNLNESSCSCSEKDTASRFDGLKDFVSHNR
jgi:uncharacterized protein